MKLDSIIKKANKIKTEAHRGYMYQLELIGKLNVDIAKAEANNNKEVSLLLKLEKSKLEFRATIYKERLMLIEDLGL